jgi:hypothetical protein
LKVKIDKYIAQLYVNKKLSYEVSLEWILGYINKEYSRHISKGLLNKQLSEYVYQEIDDDIIEGIYKKFDAKIGVDEVVNFLCIMAFALGGEE